MIGYGIWPQFYDSCAPQGWQDFVEEVSSFRLVLLLPMNQKRLSLAFGNLKQVTSIPLSRTL